MSLLICVDLKISASNPSRISLVARIEGRIRTSIVSNYLYLLGNPKTFLRAADTEMGPKYTKLGLQAEKSRAHHITKRIHV